MPGGVVVLVFSFLQGIRAGGQGAEARRAVRAWLQRRGPLLVAASDRRAADGGGVP